MSKSISLPYLQKNRSKVLKPVQLSIKSHSSIDSPSKSPSPKNTDSTFYPKTTRESTKTISIDTLSGSTRMPKNIDSMDQFRKRQQTDRNRKNPKASSPSLAHLKMIRQDKLKPISFEIIKAEGKQSELFIEPSSKRDLSPETASEKIQRCKSVEVIELTENRLSDKGLAAFMGSVEIRNIKDLCLSDNIISSKVVKQISEILMDSKCNLRHLTLESTCLDNSSAVIIFESLALNTSITRLNLGRNSLNDGCCNILKSMLSLNNSIKKLDLHWNQITSQGCLQVFEGLRDNKTLKKLDLSWNLLSKDIEENTIKAIIEIIQSQNTLKHLDLSSNYLSSHQCQFFASGLEKNQSLIGLHLLGNECHVDSRGFIHPEKHDENRPEYRKKRVWNDKKKGAGLSNCWLCEKWVEMKFIWTGDVSDPICIHLECDDYQPDIMSKDGDYYSITRVVPSGEVRFFFSINLVIVKAKDIPVKKLLNPIEKEIEFWNSSKVKITISYVNQVEGKGKVYNTSGQFSVLPRTPKLTFKPDTSPLERIPWKYSSSIFKNYIKDNIELLADCFDFDFRHSRISSIVKDSNDIEKTKKLLLKNYKVLKEAYKNFASFSENEIPGISENTILDLLSGLDLFDENYTQHQFQKHWDTVLVPSIREEVYNPGDSLARHEFLELIVRIAHENFLVTKVCPNLFESTEKLLKDYLLPAFIKLDSSEWRDDVFHCESIDVVLRSHVLILESLFDKYSGRKTIPGQNNFMSLEEFRDLCYDANLISSQLTCKDVNLIFYQAMMTQVDELYKKRHTEMHFCEFIEGIARVLNIANIGVSGESNQDDDCSISLKEKIENGLAWLLEICSEAIKESFVFPTEETYEKLMYRAKGVIYRSTTLNLLDVSY